jgi:hypothetical protein
MRLNLMGTTELTKVGKFPLAGLRLPYGGQIDSSTSSHHLHEPLYPLHKPVHGI